VPPRLGRDQRIDVEQTAFVEGAAEIPRRSTKLTKEKRDTDERGGLYQTGCGSGKSSWRMIGTLRAAVEYD
jgi:hypothetical protein